MSSGPLECCYVVYRLLTMGPWFFFIVHQVVQTAKLNSLKVGTKICYLFYSIVWFDLLLLSIKIAKKNVYLTTKEW